MFGFGEPIELKIIPELLLQGEVLDDKFNYAKAVSEDNVFGILVITNRRILFVGKGLSGSRTDDYLFSNIASVSSATLFPGASHHNVSITTKGNTAKYTNVPSGSAKDFVKRARELIFMATQPIDQAAGELDDYVFCMKCGQKLPKAAEFCMKCGARLYK
jgi:ribosomal protein L40E